MSKRKRGKYEIGEAILYNSEPRTIVDKIMGGKTKKPNIQGGIVTGYKSKSPVYKLDNGLLLRGNKLRKSTENEIQTNQQDNR